MSSVGIRSVAVEFPEVRAATGHVWRVVEISERLGAAILLALTGPAVLLAALAIAAISRRPPFVAHRRVAQGGRPLWILKLRTMWDRRLPRNRVHRRALVERLTPLNCANRIQKSFNDPRITSPFAAFCRRYSIDELPQLWHVVRGEMALVGPRPLTERELDEHYGRDAGLVLAQRPGLTGLWQVRGRSRLNYRQRRRLDLFLVRKWSLRLYFLILFATLPKVLSGKDAW